MSKNRNRRNNPKQGTEEQVGDKDKGANSPESGATVKKPEVKPSVLSVQSDLQRHIESKLTGIRKSKRNLENELANLEGLKGKLIEIGKEEEYLVDQLELVAA